MKLTDARIAELAGTAWDGLIPGFGCRVYESGKKVFVLKYRYRGVQRIDTLGPASVFKVDAARDLAREYLQHVARGKDPRFMLHGGVTFEQMTEKYLELYARPHKKSWQKDEERLKIHALPVLGRIFLSDIRRPQLIELHARISEYKPTQANRVLEIIRKMFNLAIEWGLHEGENPAKGIRKNRERERSRALTTDEVARLKLALKPEPRVAQCAFWLYLLLGVRKSELHNATWQDIDWERRVLRQSDTKSGEPLYKALPRSAYLILRYLYRRRRNDFVLGTGLRKRNSDSQILTVRDDVQLRVSLFKVWSRARKRGGFDDVRIHDLRRTVATWANNSGVPLRDISRLLNHSSELATPRYIVLQNGLARERAVLEAHALSLKAAGRGR